MNEVTRRERFLPWRRAQSPIRPCEHILARGKRYDVANYKNVTIPTNLDVSEAARTQFGAFYAALLDQTVEKNPAAVVTEYS